ncbi:hypothetical protein PVK06_023523 [Gossypium arboreum]|uniref:DUF4283 domain-containing protein n=1 Tax=Gossypium arboreum TaxID=29729 RepID=A0ABR0PBI4_GOSAR|nr:hypothetical protein PVK06_023523 [Gossypium arboreum]
MDVEQNMADLSHGMRRMRCCSWSMQTTLTNIWHSIEGISISNKNERRYLFRLYHTVDVKIIKVEGPWNFNSHLLIMHQLKDGDEPMVVPLFTVDFWVLIHDLPDGFMPEMVAKQLGNFIGVFLEYDVKVVSLGYKGIMRVRVRLDIRKLLKCEQ